MFRFLESICYDGKGYPLLSYHQERVDRVYKDNYGKQRSLQLRDILPQEISGSQIHKARVLYDNKGHWTEVIPYQKKLISSLQVVKSDITYRHKYTDRSQIEQLFQQRKQADDVLIVREGLLTDTSYANVALLKNNVWYTPEKPLLQGVRRARLLTQGRITTCDIPLEEISQYEQLAMFNAMIDLGEIAIPTEYIRISL